VNTRALLADRIANHDLCPGTDTVDAWLNVNWVGFPFGSKLVPLILLWGLRKALVVHDVHHAMRGYVTTWYGEREIAAWEVASGGCGWNLMFWLDRLVAVLLGFVFCPVRTGRALRAGFGQRNLSGTPVDELLGADVVELKQRMRL
jgi:hypothetical protein